MPNTRYNAPIPDLRIVPIENILPHESHDNQRSEPLVERLRREDVVINPPIVAPMGMNQFVILDGANRCHAFTDLGYPHLLVQVVDYGSEYVELDTWKHVVSGWSFAGLMEEIHALPDVEVVEGQDTRAIAHVIDSQNTVFAVCTPVDSTHERNAALRGVVALYQQQARLNRTALHNPETIWPLFPDAAALVSFPRCVPADIIAAARYQAFFPPGVSRHIVHGRALRVNYPLKALLDTETSLRDKNETLKAWMQQKLAERQVRYYAEATYQFDE